MAKVKITNRSGVTKAFPMHGDVKMIKAGASAAVELRPGWLTRPIFDGLKAQNVDIELPEGHDLESYSAEAEKAEKDQKKKNVKARADAEKATKAERDELEKEMAELGVPFNKNHSNANLKSMIADTKFETHLRAAATEAKIEDAETMPVADLKKLLPDVKLPA